MFFNPFNEILFHAVAFFKFCSTFLFIYIIGSVIVAVQQEWRVPVPLYRCPVCKFIHPVGQLLFYVIICRVVILACPVIIGYFYVCTAGCFELIFHGSLETARAPVLYRLSKTFLPVDLAFVINSCLFRPFHESGCIQQDDSLRYLLFHYILFDKRQIYRLAF